MVRCRYMNPCEIQTFPIAGQYDRLARTTFPNAYQVADKLHVLREVLEQLQSVRIRHRQAILALERKKNKTVQEKLPLQEKFSSEETLKQLLHRSRGLLFKCKKEWTEDQKERAKILFKQFPEIEEAYKYCLRIRKWYEPIRPRYSDRKYKIKEADLTLITKEGMESGVEEIRNIANFLKSNSTPILRYFYRRENNAKAEALNQNLRRFVSVNYGARNTDFFLYRIALHFS